MALHQPGPIFNLHTAVRAQTMAESLDGIEAHAASANSGHSDANAPPGLQKTTDLHKFNIEPYRRGFRLGGIQQHGNNANFYHCVYSILSMFLGCRSPLTIKIGSGA